MLSAETNPQIQPEIKTSLKLKPLKRVAARMGIGMGIMVAAVSCGEQLQTAPTKPQRPAAEFKLLYDGNPDIYRMKDLDNGQICYIVRSDSNSVAIDCTIQERSTPTAR